VARGIALRHLLMNNPAAGRHPLNIAGSNDTAISDAVPVFDSTRKNVGDGFDATVGVPREAGQIIFRLIVSEIVQEEKRIKLTGIAEPNAR